MSPVTHFLAGWMIGQAAKLSRRDRAWVTVAGIIPDADGLGVIVEVATRNRAHPLTWWSDYHHVLGHNLTFAMIFTALAFAFCNRRIACAGLALLSFHVHLFCDVIGARGPDGYQWPVPYLMPFSREPQWVWSGQWSLNAWPNMLFTAVLILGTILLARRRGYSPLELASSKVDSVFVAAIRNRFPVTD